MPFIAKDAKIHVNGVALNLIDDSCFEFHEPLSGCDAPSFVSVPCAMLSFSVDAPCAIDPGFFDMAYSFTLLPLRQQVPRQRFKPHPHNRRWRRRRAYIAKKLAMPPHSLRIDGAMLKSISPDGTQLEFLVSPPIAMA